MTTLPSVVPVAIEDDTTTSAAINVSGQTITGFEFPASFDGATITLLAASKASTTYRTVKNSSDGTTLTIYAGADAYVPINPATLAGIQHFKIVSASPMTADRSVNVIVRRID
jgi:hypothetical protein